jgi:hypothetical protein
MHTVHASSISSRSGGHESLRQLKNSVRSDGFGVNAWNGDWHGRKLEGLGLYGNQAATAGVAQAQDVDSKSACLIQIAWLGFRL